MYSQDEVHALIAEKNAALAENARLKARCASEHEGQLDAMALVLNHEGHIEKLNKQLRSLKLTLEDAFSQKELFWMKEILASGLNTLDSLIAKGDKHEQNKTG